MRTIYGLDRDEVEVLAFETGELLERDSEGRLRVTVADVQYVSLAAVGYGEASRMMHLTVPPDVFEALAAESGATRPYTCPLGCRHLAHQTATAWMTYTEATS